MRLLNRPLAFVLALALAATGVIVAIEVVAYALDTGPVVVPWTTWAHWAADTHWNRAVVKVWAIILIVIGLVVLLLELKPRRGTRLQLSGHNEHTDVAITRKGLAGAIRAAVLDVDGIAKAETIAARRSVRVKAIASAHDTEAAEELTDMVAAAAHRELDSLELKQTVRFRAKVKAAND